MDGTIDVTAKPVGIYAANKTDDQLIYYFNNSTSNNSIRLCKNPSVLSVPLGPLSLVPKMVLALILSSYTINVRRLGYVEASQIVMKWADRCAELRRLDPSRREFSVRVRRRIEETLRDRIPPMRLDTLRKSNLEESRALK